MALKDYRNTRTQQGGGNGGTANLGSTAVEVIKVSVNDGVQEIQGKLLFDSIGRKAGDEVLVRSAPDYAAKNAENLKRGMGTSKGSTILLENVINIGDPADNVIQTRWITTAISAAKTTDETTGHHLRSVDQAFVQTPVIGFRNPKAGPNAKDEPAYLTIGLNSSTAYARINGRNTRVNREYVVERLSQLVDHHGVRVTSLAVQPDMSEKVANLDEAMKLIGDFTDDNGGRAVVRVRDEQNDVVVAVVDRRYNKESGANETRDEMVKRLNENNIIRSVPNADLAEQIASGDWQLEVMPAIEVPYLGDSLMRMVEMAKQPDVTQMSGVNITYGAEGFGRVTRAIIVTMPTKNGQAYLVNDPLRIGDGDRTSLSYIKTPHFDVPEPARDAAATNDGADNAPAAGGEEFGGEPEGYEFVPATEEEVAQGNAARARRGM